MFYPPNLEAFISDFIAKRVSFFGEEPFLGNFLFSSIKMNADEIGLGGRLNGIPTTVFGRRNRTFFPSSRDGGEYDACFKKRFLFLSPITMFRM